MIIDDGSTDGTYERCLQLISACETAFLLRQPHSGVSVARNLGMKRAHGDYICFLDADDTYTANAFLRGMELARGEADVVMGGMQQICTDRKVTIAHANFEGCTRHRVYQKDELTKLKRWVMERNPSEFLELPAPINQQGQHVDNALRMGSVSGKFYRREVIKGAKFIPGLGYSEDLIFTYHLFDNIDTFLISEEVIYNYYMNTTSVTHKEFNAHAVTDGLALSNELVQIKNDYDNTFEQFVYRKIIRIFFMSIIKGILSNPNQRFSQQQKKILCLMNEPVYRRVLKKVNTHSMSKKYVIATLLGKFHCAGILIVIGKLLQVRKK